MLIGNTVISNSAGSPGFGGQGGGFCFDSAPGATLISNIVTENSTLGNGGGLLLMRSDISLINNVVTDNQAGGLGSGLYVQDSSPELLHTTIARNSGGDGSGVYVTDMVGPVSTMAMTNTIFVSHTVGLTITTGNTATLNGVLWYNNAVKTGGDGFITATNEYTGNPAFAADGYHLTADSAAIDKGVNASVGTDIDGDPRPVDGDLDGIAITDLGADEYLLRMHLPIILKNFRS